MYIGNQQHMYFIMISLPAKPGQFRCHTTKISQNCYEPVDFYHLKELSNNIGFVRNEVVFLVDFFRVCFHFFLFMFNQTGPKVVSKMLVGEV